MRQTLILLLTLLSAETFSCTCADNVTDKQLIDNSDYAFIGEVIKSVYKDLVTGVTSYQNDIRPDAKVKVIKVLKGKIKDTEIIVISSESPSCEINLIPGRRYLITGKATPIKLRPLDTSEIELPPTDIDTNATNDTLKFEHTNYKTKGQWIKELQGKSFVVFTDVCSTRLKKK